MGELVVANPAWHRRQRATRIAARHLLASAAAVIKSGAQLPALVAAKLPSAASVVEQHHGSAVPKAVQQYMAAANGDEAAGQWARPPRAKLRDSNGSLPKKGRLGGLYALCGRGGCTRWYYIHALPGAYCACGCRWSADIISKAVDAGASHSSLPRPGGTLQSSKGKGKAGKGGKGQQVEPGKGGKQNGKDSDALPPRFVTLKDFKGKDGGKGGGKSKSSDGPAKGQGRKGKDEAALKGKGQLLDAGGSGGGNGNDVADRGLPWMRSPNPTEWNRNNIQHLQELLDAAKLAGAVSGGADLTFTQPVDEPQAEEQAEPSDELPSDLPAAHRRVRQLENRANTAWRKVQRSVTTYEEKHKLVEELEEKLEEARKTSAEAWDAANKRKLEHQEADAKLEQARIHRRSLEGLPDGEQPAKQIQIDPAQPVWDNLVQQMVTALQQGTQLASATVQQQVQVKQAIINAVAVAQTVVQQVQAHSAAASNAYAAAIEFDQDEDMESDASSDEDSKEVLEKKRERRAAKSTMAKANRVLQRESIKSSAKPRSQETKDTIKPHLKQQRRTVVVIPDGDQADSKQEDEQSDL